jgi:hypothetical protein
MGCLAEPQGGRVMTYDVVIYEPDGTVALDTARLSLRDARARRAWLIDWAGYEPDHVRVEESQ